MAGARVLIVEDDVPLARAIEKALLTCSDLQLETKVLSRGDLVMRVVARWMPDVVLLDLGLPKLHGYKVLKQLQLYMPRVRCCIISQSDTVEDRLFGFRQGTDDYLVKPFSLPELVARVGAMLKRSKIITGSTIVTGALCLSSESKTLVREGVHIRLTMREFSLLRYLMERPGDVVTRDELLDQVWEGKERFPNVVDAHIELLRRKVDKPFGSAVIHTAYKNGYYFEFAKS